MSSGRGNKADQDIYIPPARRSLEGSGQSTPTENKNQRANRELPPNCCEDEDDVVGNSSVRSGSSSEKSVNSSFSQRRTDVPASPKEISSDLTQNLQFKCNIAQQRFDNNKKIPTPTRLVVGTRNIESSPGCSNDARKNSLGNNSPRFSTLLEELHLADTPYIDSHCHTDFIYTQLSRTVRDFKEDEGIEKWVDRYPAAFPKAFAGLIANFIKPDLFVKENIEYDLDWILNEIRSNIYIGTTWGCHPHYAEKWGTKRNFWTTLNHILTNTSTYKVLAVGECGIDLHRCESDLEIQKDVFDRHVDMAYSHNLPLVIHCRNGKQGKAEDICLEILGKRKETYHRNLKIHRHCYTENWPIARKWLQQCPEVHFGYTPGILSFNESQIEAVRRIPLDRILLETDAPYFKPKCFDGIAPNKVSLPGMAIATAARIADIKKCSLEEVLRATYNNTRRVYQIPVY